MKSFVFAYYGVPKFDTPADGKQHMAKWKAWVDGLGAALTDPGKPVAAPKNVSARGISDRAGSDRFTGYSVIQADSMEAALAMAQECPHIEHGTIDVAEIMPMSMKP
jgi:hypothetical protein